MKREKKARAEGTVEVRLVKFPGKRGQISSYPDSWIVALVFMQKDRGENVITLRNTEDYDEAMQFYEHYTRFLKTSEKGMRSFL